MNNRPKSQTDYHVLKNIFKIVDLDGKFYGTGFAIKINDTKYVITCHHCIYKLKQIYIQKKIGESYGVYWLANLSDMNKDIAVLEIKDGPFEDLLYTKEALPGLNVIAYGYSAIGLANLPNGAPSNKLTLSTPMDFYWPAETSIGHEWNNKPEVNVTVFNTSDNIHPGYSGAPVCYVNNQIVVGVFMAMDDKNGYVIPIDTILEKFLDQGIVSDPSPKINTYHYISKGNEYFKKADYDKALVEYGTALSDPNYAIAFYNKALTLRKKKKYCEAITFYEKALTIDPTNIDALIGVGVCMYRLERYDDAITFYEKALTIDPNRITIKNNINVAQKLKNPLQD